MTAVAALRAPAKLTLSLRIDGVRDDGYHLIDAEMVTLDLHDDLRIGPGDRLAITGDVPGIDGEDLVTQALGLVERAAAVELHKRIPSGAGLGGGSADAAAILRWAGWKDLRAASRLGADVAFCLVGGRARVRGIGDVVEPLPPTGRTFTLLTPPVRCPTQAVYDTWDDMGGPQGEHGNDLEPAAVRLVPDLVDWRDRLGEVAGQRPRLAGSGSTWFIDGSFPGEGRVVVHTADVNGVVIPEQAG